MKAKDIIKGYFADEKKSFMETVGKLREGVCSFYKECVRVIHSIVSDSKESKKKTQQQKIEEKRKTQKVVFVVSVSIGVVVFFLWQYFAYDFSQTTFVSVNVAFFMVLCLIIGLILYRNQKAIRQLNGTIDDMNFAKKKRDQEIAQMKTELLDLRMMARRQTTFGKNSQALIEAVQRYKAEMKPNDMKAQYLLRALSECYQICCGVVYVYNEGTGKYDLAGEYALNTSPEKKEIDEKDGLIGQVVIEGKPICHSNVSVDYMSIISGLGKAELVNLYILPIRNGEKTVAIIEISSFSKLTVVDVWKDIEGLLLAEL